MLSGLLCAAGASLSVFGIEALKAAPATGSQNSKRPRDPPSVQQDSSSAASNKRSRTENPAAAAATAERAESATAASPPAEASNGEQRTHGLEAERGAEHSREGVEPAGSFSFPVLSGREGNGPSSIKTPAPKPKSVSSKPRYPVAEDYPIRTVTERTAGCGDCAQDWVVASKSCSKHISALCSSHTSLTGCLQRDVHKCCFSAARKYK